MPPLIQSSNLQISLSDNLVPPFGIFEKLGLCLIAPKIAAFRAVIVFLMLVKPCKLIPAASVLALWQPAVAHLEVNKGETKAANLALAASQVFVLLSIGGLMSSSTSDLQLRTVTNRKDKTVEVIKRDFFIWNFFLFSFFVKLMIQSSITFGLYTIAECGVFVIPKIGDRMGWKVPK